MRADAEKAMNRLQGYGYDHLILKIEWARPSQKKVFVCSCIGKLWCSNLQPSPLQPDGAGGGHGSGLSGGFTSGYGKALPQGMGK
jgi:hypothetical protein